MERVMSLLKKIKKTRGFLAGVIISAIAFFFIHARTANDPYFEISKNLDIYADLFKELNTYYVDPIEPGKLVKTGVVRGNLFHVMQRLTADECFGESLGAFRDR